MSDAINSDDLNINPETLESRKYAMTISEDITDSGHKRPLHYSNDLKALCDIVIKYKDSDDKTENNCYETLNKTMRRFYIDVDLKRIAGASNYGYIIKSDENITDFVNVIMDRVINEIQIINPDITDIKYTIHYGQQTTDEGDIVITGIHIIALNVYMDCREMLRFIRWVNSEFGLKLDDKVYNKVGQHFKLPYNTKKGKDSVYYEFNEELHPSKYLISNLEDMSQDRIFQFCIEDVKTADMTEIPEADKEVIVYKDFIDVFNKIIDEDMLEVYFWANSKDWVLVSKILKRLDIYELDYWSAMSAKKSDNQYSKDDNDDFLNNMSMKGFECQYPMLIKTLEKYLPKYKLVWDSSIGLFDDNLKEFIETSFNIQDATNIVSGLNDERSKLKPELRRKATIEIDGYIFNLHNGLISFEGNVVNYYGHLNRQYYLKDDTTYTKVDFDYIAETISDPEIMRRITDALNSGSRYTISLRAFMGQGKSYNILRNMLQMENRPYLRRYGLSPNNAFNFESVESLSKCINNFDWTSHTNIANLKAEGKNIKNYNIVSSLESIKTITDNARHIDELYIDEFETLMGHFGSSTIKESKRYELFRQFKEIVSKADVVILLDAYLTPERINIINKIRGGNAKSLSIDVISNTYQTTTEHIVYDELAGFNDVLYNNAKTEKVVIFTNSKNKCEKMLNAIIARKDISDKMVMLLNSDGIMVCRINKPSEGAFEGVICKEIIIPYGQDEKERAEFYKKLEHNISIKYNVDILIYSPTLSVGNSINKAHFHSAYGSFNNSSIDATQGLQMIYRCRNLTSKKIHLFISNKIQQPVPRVGLGSYRESLSENVKYLTKDIVLTKNQHLNTITDEVYYTMMANNAREKEESKTDFMGCFYRGLSVVHNIPIKWVISEVKKNPLKMKDIKRQIFNNSYRDMKFIGDTDKTDTIDTRATNIINAYRLLYNEIKSEVIDENNKKVSIPLEKKNTYKFMSSVMEFIDEKECLKGKKTTENTPKAFGVIPLRQLLEMGNKMYSYEWWLKFVHSDKNKSIVRQIRYIAIPAEEGSFGKLGKSNIVSFATDEKEEVISAKINKNGFDKTNDNLGYSIVNKMILLVLELLNINQVYHTYISTTDFHNVIGGSDELDEIVKSRHTAIRKKTSRPTDKANKADDGEPMRDWWYSEIKSILSLIGMDMGFIDSHQQQIKISPTDLFRFDEFNKDIHLFNQYIRGVDVNYNKEVLTYTTTHTSYERVKSKHITITKDYDRTINFDDVSSVLKSKLYIGSNPLILPSEEIEEEEDKRPDEDIISDVLSQMVDVISDTENDICISKGSDGVYRQFEGEYKEPSKQETSDIIMYESNEETIPIFLDTNDPNCIKYMAGLTTKSGAKKRRQYSKSDNIGLVKSSHFKFYKKHSLTAPEIERYNTDISGMDCRASYNRGLLSDTLPQYPEEFF